MGVQDSQHRTRHQSPCSQSHRANAVRATGGACGMAMLVRLPRTRGRHGMRPTRPCAMPTSISSNDGSWEDRVDPHKARASHVARARRAALHLPMRQCSAECIIPNFKDQPEQPPLNKTICLCVDIATVAMTMAPHRSSALTSLGCPQSTTRNAPEWPAASLPGWKVKPPLVR